MKDLIRCKCCPKEFTPHYDFRTKMLKSKICPSCQYKKAYEKSGGGNSFFDGKKRKGKGSKRGKSSKSKAMGLADKWFSQYIRIRHSVELGGELFCRCIVSGKLYHILKVDAGHYFPRGHKSTRFDERNVWPQNRSSNRYKGENDKHIFKKNLIAKIGEEEYKKLEALHLECGYDTEEYYNEISEKYKKLTREEIKKHDINPWKAK